MKKCDEVRKQIALLTVQERLCIAADVADGVSLLVVAAMYGVFVDTVTCIALNKTPREVCG